MILVMLETPISKAGLESLCCATKLGDAVTVGLVGEGAQAAANSIGGCGARFMAVEGEAFSVSRYSTDAAAAEALIRASSATLVIAPCSHRWQRALPGVAQRVGGAVDTHAVDIAPGAIRRWYYRQRIEVTLSRTTTPWIILREPGAGDPWQGSPAEVAVEWIDVLSPSTRTVVEGVEAQAADQQTIRPEANLLFVAGAGWTKKQKDGATHTDQAAELILQFVTKAKASLGSSKSLVDQSGEGQAVLPFLSHLHQVGQTGSTPRHRKGLATCCHGEEPHVVGWRFINERRAVNLDPNCGWARGKADVLYVADAFEVMREVSRLLS